MAGVRAKAAAALAPTPDDDLSVFDNVVDALVPPALVLTWDDPWLTPKVVASCIWDARFSVIAVAGRVEPDPGIATLETLIEYVVTRLRADDYTWPVATVQEPREFRLSGIAYLGARLTYAIQVSVGG